jgi:starch phosphorylase
LTLGFARRFAAYKRPDLLLADVERLKRLSREIGPIQIIYAGKAHPADGAGKEMLKAVFRAREELKGHVRIAFVPNYDMETSKFLTSGCDVWINTPKRPMEASGTSGMKAAINGVPSLSVLDGWWIEGCIEGVTGWAIGGSGATSAEAVSDAEEARSLYDKLERQVLPMYYHQREDFMSVMRNAIAFNGSFFNTQRMILQYVLKAYFC